MRSRRALLALALALVLLLAVLLGPALAAAAGDDAAIVNAARLLPSGAAASLQSLTLRVRGLGTAVVSALVVRAAFGQRVAGEGSAAMGACRLICGTELVESHPEMPANASEANITAVLPLFFVPLLPGSRAAWPLLDALHIALPASDELVGALIVNATVIPAGRGRDAGRVVASLTSAPVEACKLRFLPRVEQTWPGNGVLLEGTMQVRPRCCTPSPAVRWSLTTVGVAGGRHRATSVARRQAVPVSCGAPTFSRHPAAHCCPCPRAGVVWTGRVRNDGAVA